MPRRCALERCARPLPSTKRADALYCTPAHRAEAGKRRRIDALRAEHIARHRRLARSVTGP